MFSSTKSGNNLSTASIAGGVTFLDNGTYSLVIPSNVTSITALAIGAGGGGGGTSSAATSSAAGGGGGALSYGNITVTPNETLTIVVGTGGAAGTNAGTSGGNGGDSYIRRSSTDLLLAKGGSGGFGNTGSGTGGGGAGGAAASGVGDTKQSGGNGGGRATNDRGGGGGGAAGYSGTGGAGGSSTTAPTAGSGGGGGGGFYGLDGSSALVDGGFGGGVQVYGAGSSGAAGIQGTSTDRNGDTGSSLGGTTSGAYYPGASGGGASSTGLGGAGGTAYDGAVRILWGNNASFPSTNVTNTGLALFASVVSSGTTITAPSGLRPGDAMILFDYAQNVSGLPTAVTPTGFGASYSTNNASDTYIRISRRMVLDEAESSTTITGMSGTSSVQKILLVFRGNAGYFGQTTDDTDANSEIGTSSAPTTQVKNLSSYDSYANGIPIVLAYFNGSLGITPSTDLTFSGATFVQGTSNVWYAGYKIYSQSTTSVNDSISMLDRGVNTMVSIIMQGF